MADPASHGIAGPEGRERAVALVRRAVELGVDHIDTAAFYPSYPTPQDMTVLHGVTHELLREALAPYGAEVVVATKVGPTPEGLARPDQLRGLVEDDLRLLGREHLDVVNLRQFGLESVVEHVGALAELQQAGLVRHLGLSNVDRVRAVLRAGRRGSRGRGCEAPRRGARDRAGAPGDGGAGPARVDAEPGTHVLAIPGTSDPAHLAENLGAGELRLTAEELATLE